MRFQRILCTIFLSVPLAAIGLPSYQKTWALEKDPEPVIPYTPKSGGSGAFLTAIYAARIGDNLKSAELFNQILQQNKDNKKIQQNAFFYSVLAGSDQAFVLAKAQKDDPVAALVLGNEAAIKNNWQEAITYYKQTTSDPLGALSSDLLQAWCLFGKGQTDQAFVALDVGSKKTLLPGVYIFHKGIMAFMDGRTDQASQLFSQTSRMFSGVDLMLTQTYGHVLVKQGRPGKAQAMVHDLVTVLPNLAIAEKDLDKALSRFPVHNTQEAMAQVYLAIASSIQQDIASQDSDNDDIQTDPQRIMALHTEQMVLQFALQMNPQLSSARLLLAGIMADEKHIEQAIRILQAINENDPLKTVAQLRLARLNALLGKKSEADAILKELITKYPNQIDPWQSWGDISLESKDYQQAIHAYTKAIQIERHITMADWPLYFARAIAYDKMNQWPKAQKDLETALKLAPNEAVLLNYLGYSWTLRKINLSEAQIMLQRAVDIAPEEAAIRDSLGWAMIMNNQIKEGVRNLEDASKKIPEDPELNYHLGVAYWKVGRFQEAINQWHVALSCHPESDVKALIVKALEDANKKKPNLSFMKEERK